MLTCRPSRLIFLSSRPRFDGSIRSLVCGFLPPDDDTARYLSEALATSNQDQGRRWSAPDVKNALEETRMRKEMTELGFEDRVSAALSILGV